MWSHALLAAVRRFGDRDLAEEFEGAEPCFELTLSRRWTEAATWSA